jgi:hypothetical protein
MKKTFINKNDINRLYNSNPTIIDYLPWRDFNEEHKFILLEDNESLGVCFKIFPLGCEARPESMLNEIAFRKRVSLDFAVVR